MTRANETPVPEKNDKTQLVGRPNSEGISSSLSMNGQLLHAPLGIGIDEWMHERTVRTVRTIRTDPRRASIRNARTKVRTQASLSNNHMRLAERNVRCEREI